MKRLAVVSSCLLLAACGNPSIRSAGEVACTRSTEIKAAVEAYAKEDTTWVQAVGDAIDLLCLWLEAQNKPPAMHNFYRP